MCGFFVSVNDTAVDVRGLTESIKHRGPDSTKYHIGKNVLCGFNRLAIVDNDPLSDQPMIDSSGRYVLVFNGEIYNYQKLRGDLEQRFGVQFQTRSDTEVLLYGLKHEGASFASKLDGIYAFAFIDLESLEVILARDVFGVKPLYYRANRDRLYASSEIKPLRQLTRGAIDFASIARYLSYGVVGNGASLVAGINELDANTVMTFRLGRQPLVERIREFEYDIDDGIPVEKLSAILFDTVDSQKPNISYGVLFSGGIDSTFILDRCAADRHFFGAYSVDVNHPDMSERSWQELAVRTLKVENRYRRIDLRQEDFSLEGIQKVARGLDCPLFHPNFIGSFLLTRAAADDGLKVLLSGEGADELFLGYRWFFSDQPAADYLEYVPLQDLHSLLRVVGAGPVDTAGMSKLEIFQKIYLRRWLLRQDLTGMANSVEVRVPFLGIELADTVNKLSIRFKQGDGESKWLIKRLLAPKFSREFLQRKKVGFDFPLNNWMNAEHVDFLRQRTDIVDEAALETMMEKYKSSYMKNRLIFSLVSLALWCDSL